MLLMNSENLKEQPSSQREIIKGSLSRAKMLWDDTRASSDIGPMLGSPLMVIQATPQSLNEAQESSQKQGVMSALIDTAVTVGGTKSFRKYMLTTVFSPQYDFGIPSDNLFPQLGIDLSQDKLGVFEPGNLKETERELLEAELKSACLFLVGTFGIYIPEQEEEQLTLIDSATIARNLFFNHQVNRLISRDEVREVADRSLPGGFELLAFRLERINDAVEWTKEMAVKYNNESFAEVAETLKPILVYLEVTE